LIGCAVAKERHRHAAIAAELGAKRSTGRDCKAATNDPIRAEDSLGEIRNVHRSPHALADTRAFSPYLGHHRFRIAALCQEMTMTSVCAGNPIRIVQVGTNADRNGLLTNIEMYAPWELACRCVGLQALLHEPYERHPLK